MNTNNTFASIITTRAQKKKNSEINPPAPSLHQKTFCSKKTEENITLNIQKQPPNPLTNPIQNITIQYSTLENNQTFTKTFDFNEYLQSQNKNTSTICNLQKPITTTHQNKLRYTSIGTQTENQENQHQNLSDIGSSKNCEHCNILKEETSNMVHAIRCLESENKILNKKVEVLNMSNRTSQIFSKYDKYASKNLKNTSCYSPLPLTNRFSVLNDSTSFDKTCDNQLQNLNTNTKISQQKQKTVKQRNQNNDSKLKRKVYVFSDSHGRNLHDEISSRLSSKTKTTVFFKPNAKIEHVLKPLKSETKEFTKDDCAIIIAGSNNFGTSNQFDKNNTTEKIIHSLKQTIQNCQNTNILISTIPLRYDLDKNSSTNIEIKETNKQIRHLGNNFTNCAIIDTSKLKRSDYTKHGLHFNKYGKSKLGNEIKHLLTNCQHQAIQNLQNETEDVDKPESHYEIRSTFTENLATTRYLPHATFAEALKFNSTKTSNYLGMSNNSNHCNQQFFLGNHL